MMPQGTPGASVVPGGYMPMPMSMQPMMMYPPQGYHSQQIQHYSQHPIAPAPANVYHDPSKTHGGGDYSQGQGEGPHFNNPPPPHHPHHNP